MNFSQTITILERSTALLQGLMITDVIKENFRKPTTNEYFHYVLKNCFDQRTYENGFAPKLKEIENKTGKPASLDATSVHGLTPLHIGAVKGNIIGVKQLLQSGASQNLKDNSGKTAYDYALTFGHTEIAQLLKTYSQQKKNTSNQVNLSSPMHQLLERWKVNLPDVPFNSLEKTHDFGVEIKKLLFARPTESFKHKIKHFVANMKQIAKIEGFTLDSNTVSLIPRDFLIQTSNGIKTPNCLSNVEKAVERFNSHALMHNFDRWTDSEFFNFGAPGALGKKALEIGLEYFGLFNKPPSPLPFYMEGGNHLIVTNVKDKKVALMGKDQELLILVQLILDGFFKDKEVELSDKIEKNKKSLTESQIKETLDEMYSLKLLKESPSCPKGFINLDDYVSILSEGMMQLDFGTPFHHEIFANLALKQEKYIPLRLPSHEIERCREFVSLYLARKEAAKELIAKNLSVESENLYFVPQLDYHLDVFIHPGPGGSLFVQDHDMTKELFENILKNKDQLNLSKEDLRMLKRYHSRASKLAKHFRNMKEKTQAVLKQAGFNLIPTPGLFYDECQDSNYENMKNGNFLNAVTGWSPHTKRHYWITSGVTVGDRLGPVLMESFKEFLKAYQKDIEVYFIGNDPDNPKDYSEAMSFLRDSTSKAGVHCLSFELETASVIRQTNPKFKDLSGKEMTDFSDSAFLDRKLEELWIDDNQITEIPGRIRELTALKRLSIVKNNLEDLPEELFSLANLEKLNLHANQLLFIPQNIAKLKKLQEFDISHNGLEWLQDSIGELENLCFFNAKGNKLESLPQTYKHLKELKSLDISDNHFKNLPECLQGMQNLNELKVSRNEIKELPDFLMDCKNLKEIHAKSNKISSLPASIGELENLKIINLSDNQLESLPPTIGNLRSLRHLDLRGNQLTSLPESMRRLCQLKKLDLRSNKGLQLPEWIKEFKDRKCEVLY